MKRTPVIFAALTLAFTLLMSLPWLVPHCGWAALVGLLPLLLMERLASEYKVRHFWWWHYAAFVLWNAVTTWWVGMATVGGAVFAILANALQMSVIFGTFRWVKRRTGGVLPYLFLAAAWLAWEKYYLTVAEISWPWLVLGNAFAGTTSLVQWYDVLGTLGGSLWVWVSNLSLFGLMVALSDGRMARWNGKARVAAFGGTVLAILGPMVWSVIRVYQWDHESLGQQTLNVSIIQPNFDPYQKFESMTQAQQDSVFLEMAGGGYTWDQEDPFSTGPTLVVLPETFTSSFFLNQVQLNDSYRRYLSWLQKNPAATLIFGASTYDLVHSAVRPDLCAYDRGAGNWLLSHNSAISMNATGRLSVYHKSKLVVGTELTPYPRFFVPLENLLGGNLMGKCIGQKEIGCLSVANGNQVVPVGVPVCYESVYGEFCAGYIRKGARLLVVITNDAWWGNTPGYHQHFNYSRLRAIETRRAVVRCANTGLSAIINPEGQCEVSLPAWERTSLFGVVSLYSGQTFFVHYGDIVGRVSVFLFLLLLAAAVFRPKKV